MIRGILRWLWVRMKVKRWKVVGKRNSKDGKEVRILAYD
jgi:hypothetical protein